VLAGWSVTVGVVEVGVVDKRLAAATLSGRGARVYTAHRGWLGVVMGISAASTRGVVVCNNSYCDGDQTVNRR